MSRAKFYKCVFDEHCKLTCNVEGGGGGDGAMGQWGNGAMLLF